MACLPDVEEESFLCYLRRLGDICCNLLLIFDMNIKDFLVKLTKSIYLQYNNLITSDSSPIEENENSHQS